MPNVSGPKMSPFTNQFVHRLAIGPFGITCQSSAAIAAVRQLEK